MEGEPSQTLTEGDGVSRGEILEALAQVCASQAFGAKATLPRVLLEHIVNKTLEKRWDELKGIYIRRRFFGPLNEKPDSNVQVALSDLRDRLTRYYSVDGSGDPVVIEIPLAKRGAGYRASFRRSLRAERLQEVASLVSHILGRSIAVEAIEQQLDRHSMNVEAHVRYMQGLQLATRRTPESLQQAREYFKGALRFDARYARAYAAIAESWCSSAIFFEPPKAVLARAEEAALSAIALDDEIWEAHAALGTVKMCLHWDWDGAAAAFALADRVNPGALMLHLWYAVYLVACGRGEEAVRNFERARLLQPASAHVNLILGSCLLGCRRVEEAESPIRAAIDLAPGIHQPWLYLMMVQLAARKFDLAVEAMEQALACISLPERLFGFRVLCQSLAGGDRQARNTLSHLHQFADRCYVAPVQFALAYQGIGELDQAITWMSKSCDERDPLMVWLHRWPIIDELRGHSDFNGLLQRIWPLTPPAAISRR